MPPPSYRESASSYGFKGKEEMLASPMLEPITSDVEVPYCPVCGSWGITGKLLEPLHLNLLHLVLQGDSGCITCALLLAGAMDYFQLHKSPNFPGGEFWLTAEGWSLVRFSTHKDIKAVPIDGRPRQMFVLEYTYAIDDGKTSPPYLPLCEAFARSVLRDVAHIERCS